MSLRPSHHIRRWLSYLSLVGSGRSRVHAQRCSIHSLFGTISTSTRDVLKGYERCKLDNHWCLGRRGKDGSSMSSGSRGPNQGAFGPAGLNVVVRATTWRARGLLAHRSGTGQSRSNSLRSSLFPRTTGFHGARLSVDHTFREFRWRNVKSENKHRHLSHACQGW
jgi:hypothetical protein